MQEAGRWLDFNRKIYTYIADRPLLFLIAPYPAFSRSSSTA
jgi:hypothetical protein